MSTKFTYIDNSNYSPKTGAVVLQEIFADSIGEADKQFQALTGMTPAKSANIAVVLGSYEPPKPGGVLFIDGEVVPYQMVEGQIVPTIPGYVVIDGWVSKA